MMRTGPFWVGFLCLLPLSQAMTAESDSCAPFSFPQRVTDGSGKATQTATGVDVANNAYIAVVSGEKIYIKIIGPALEAEVPLAASGLGQGDPDFATASSGTTYMSFSQLDDTTPGEGRDIYLTDNQGGGPFRTPVNVSRNRADEYASRLVLDQASHPHLAWVQRVGEQTRVMYLNAGSVGSEPTPVAFGDYPHLFVDEAGIVHLVYSRLNDLYYNNNSSGSFDGEVRITTSASDPESSASIGVDPLGVVLIGFESQHSLYYSTKAPGAGFSPPLLLEAGGVFDPRMRVRSRGQVTIVYSKAGDIYYLVGQSTFLSAPQRICEPTEEVESRPSLEVDLEGNIHVSYLRDSEVYYTNTATTPVADFSAVPSVGEVPLKVRFGDLSSGKGIQVWEWDFGDGETSKEQNPVHTYTKPDRYTVSLTVSGPGGVSGYTEKQDVIFVQDPAFTMSIPNQLVFPGQKDVWFPVITKRKMESQGFQIMATFDPSYLIPKPVERSNSLLQGRSIDVYEANIFETRIEIGCILDTTDPIDTNNVLPPGENQVLQQLVFDVSESAPQGARTRLDLVNDTRISAIANMFIVEWGKSRLPVLNGSTVEIAEVNPPFPRFFVRGDSDASGVVDITDAIRILNYLFTGGAPPVCYDAADLNDRGKVDISSAVALLNYLFLGGPQPAVPFPNQGLDPSVDTLPDC